MINDFFGSPRRMTIFSESFFGANGSKNAESESKRVQ